MNALCCVTHVKTEGKHRSTEWSEALYKKAKRRPCAEVSGWSRGEYTSTPKTHVQVILSSLWQCKTHPNIMLMSYSWNHPGRMWNISPVCVFIHISQNVKSVMKSRRRLKSLRDPCPVSFPLVFTLCRSIYLRQARATETSLKPNTSANPFITLGFLASVCVLPVLQSIMFNSIGLTLLNQIWSFGYKFVFTRAAHLLMIICIWQFSRSEPETGSTQTVTRRVSVEGPTGTGLPAACRPPLIYNLLLDCHRKEHNQPRRDATEIH